MLDPPQCEMLFLRRICPIAIASIPSPMTTVAAIKFSNTLIRPIGRGYLDQMSLVENAPKSNGVEELLDLRPLCRWDVISTWRGAVASWISLSWRFERR